LYYYLFSVVKGLAAGIVPRSLSSTNEVIPASSTDVLVDIRDGVRTIKFNRQTKKNAMTADMANIIVSSLNTANADEETHVIVITGEGDYFTSGMDMTMGSKKSSQMTHPSEIGIKMTNSSPAGEKPSGSGTPTITPRKPSPAYTKFFSSFIECQKPLIALVNGPAIGVGVTMLGLCDSVYASDKATFHTRFTQFGLPPDFASTYTFPWIMGYAKANRVLLLNTKISAQEAYDVGLVSRLFPHDSFKEETTKIVGEYGQLPLKSLVYTKQLVRGREKALIQKGSDAEQSYFDPAVARETIRKFLAKKL
jgi:peroxisomal 3,2-trans-enoyl-CoA isomerase